MARPLREDLFFAASLRYFNFAFHLLILFHFCKSSNRYNTLHQGSNNTNISQWLQPPTPSFSGRKTIYLTQFLKLFYVSVFVNFTRKSLFEYHQEQIKLSYYICNPSPKSFSLGGAWGPSPPPLEIFKTMQ